MRRPLRDATGQAITETMIMMSFLLLFIFGIVYVALFAVTKFMVSYAAFAAARTSMVRSEADGYRAAVGVMQNLRWWRDESQNAPDGLMHERRFNRFGVTVTHRVPFGLPIFNDIPNGGIRVLGFAPTIVQPDIPEQGDNAGQ
jgi:hypothetical protein